jgi:hypothetical protein
MTLLNKGDKLQVNADNCYMFPIGTILTVLVSDTSCYVVYDHFSTDDPHKPNTSISWHRSYLTENVLVLIPHNAQQNSMLICECGKEKHGFTSHSLWCQKYRLN